MEKDITILKSLIEDLKREEKLIGYNAEVEIQALENLIDSCNELEEENRIFALAGSNIALKHHIEKNYIPKSKVQEKLDELDKKIRKIENKKVWNEPADTIIRNRLCNYYNALKELVEGE
jgi:hypothetical protein